MSPIKKIKNLVAYWYQRYLMVTELYMVEPWEKIVIHVMFAILLTLFWWFNTSLVVSGIARLRNTSQMEIMS